MALHPASCLAVEKADLSPTAAGACVRVREREGLPCTFISQPLSSHSFSL